VVRVGSVEQEGRYRIANAQENQLKAMRNLQQNWEQRNARKSLLEIKTKELSNLSFELNKF